MTRHSEEIASALEELGVLLELAGENSFKVRAHENAARLVRDQSQGLESFVARAQAGEIKGIGAGLAGKLAALYAGQELPELELLRNKFPSTLFELLKIPGLGVKKLKVLYEELQVASFDALETACRDGRVASLKGFGSKTADKFLHGILKAKERSNLFLFPAAESEAEQLRRYVLDGVPNSTVIVAGSLRRHKEVIGDIDLVASGQDPHALMQRFCSAPGVAEITARGETRSSVVLKSGIAADMRVVDRRSLASALLYFTGSKAHNISLRARAERMGLKLSEYGLECGGTMLEAASEEDLYRHLEISYIAPELREDLGEIEMFANVFGGKAENPQLVNERDIRGILHVHSTYSDGRNSIRELAEAVRAAGYAYLGISDHSQSARYARGLTAERVKQQHDEIDTINGAMEPFKIFKGIESDILSDGSLDYPDSVLESFDFIVASVHSGFQMSQEEMTARFMRAIENPCTTILGHLTGRLLLEREPYALDIERVLCAAASHRVVVELNANPHRLDLDWRYLRRARELGILIAVNPDAHSIQGLSDIRYGVGIARKGMLAPGDILNCRGAEELWKRVRTDP